jgi:hypothetical protein
MIFIYIEIVILHYIGIAITRMRGLLEVLLYGENTLETHLSNSALKYHLDLQRCRTA